MWNRDREYFRELKENECNDSTFMAVNLIAKRARQKLRETDGMILDSKAISWALTGESPKIHKARTINIQNHLEYYTTSQYLDDLLCNIDDEDVCESVKDTIRCSMLSNHLIYCYNHNLDESRQCRVRILSRIVWDYYINDNKGGHR